MRTSAWDFSEGTSSSATRRSWTASPAAFAHACRLPVHIRAGDIDGDGDQDVIAVAWLPPPVMPRNVLRTSPASLICLEQSQPGVFVRHVLETGFPCYATLELADFDGDGDLDFALGPGPHVANTLPSRHWLSVWRNQTVPDRTPGERPQG